MPKGKSDQKRHLKQEKRRLRNRSVRSSVKTYIGRALRAVSTADGPEAVTEVQTAALRAVRALDVAAAKGVIHKNNAARRKSRLMKRVNAAAAALQATS